jgi:progressive ankylosis protein
LKFSETKNPVTSVADPVPRTIGFKELWREFLPLSLSDITMACGDPVLTSTLAHLPDARNNLAAVGIAKTLAIFFESPIIMILHASNTLAVTALGRRLLWRFTMLAGSVLSSLLIILSLPFIFNIVGASFLGVPPALLPIVSQVLLLMGLWPFLIAWRRYFQGLLIYHGNANAIAKASIMRILTMMLVLAAGIFFKASGAVLAGSSLMLGLVVETFLITWIADRCGARVPPPPPSTTTVAPRNLKDIWHFYWPLANTMLVTWGGRALLVAILARSVDASIALAAWPAAWGLVLVIANSTRMVQQIIIKYQSQVARRLLLTFAVTVGLSCSGLLLLLSTTALGDRLIQAFIGNDRALVDGIKPVLLICTAIPLLVALQNAIQGFLVSTGLTGQVNRATIIGTVVLLSLAGTLVKVGLPGALAAAIAMGAAMLTEVSLLGRQPQRPSL